VYGKGNTFDVDRLIELLQAFETFVDVRDSAPIGPAAASTPALASAGPALALPPPGTAGLATRNNRSRRGGSLRAS